MKKLIIFCFAGALSFGSLLAQSKAGKKALKREKIEAKYNTLKQLIESEQYEFEADWAFPLGNDVTKLSSAFLGGNAVFQGNRVNLTVNSNFIRIDKENTHLFLPYFGQVNRGLSYLGAGGDNGLKYRGEIEDYRIKYKDSKKQINIKFTAKKPQEQLKIHIIVNAGGLTEVNINSSNRDNIRYQGVIRELQENESSKVAKN